MRAELHGPFDQVTLVSPDELIEFTSEAEARYFLNRFLGERHNVQALRRALGEDCGVMHVGRLLDHQVLDEVAKRLVRACVGMVRLDGPPTVPLDPGDGGPSPSDFENALAPDEEDEEVEFEEPKPEPVLPPEYPRLAKEEAGAIETETSLYKVFLTLLSYVGYKGSEESEVAKTLLSEAKGFGNSVVEATTNPSQVLVKLVSGGEKSPAKSQVRDEMVALASGHGKKLTDAAGGLGDELGGLAEKAKIEPQSSEVGSSFQKESERQGKQLLDTAESFGKTLFKVEVPEEEPADEPSDDGTATFRVLDDVTGEPLGFVKIVVKLADGTEKRLVTGKSGEVKLRGVVGEDFEVTGLVSHEELEVVAVQEEPLGD